MAEGEEKGGNPAADLLWLLFFLFILFVAWFAVGGPTRADLGSLFLQSPASIYNASSTEVISTSTSWFPVSYPQEQGVPALPGEAGAFADALGKLKQFPSLEHGRVSFRSVYGVSATDPSQEYVEIEASYGNAQPVSISGWRIQSLKTGRVAVIGTAVETPLTGSEGTPGAVVLRPGETVIIVSGRSPIGVSFRVNKCSGYLAQFQTFAPVLLPQCPAAVAELYAPNSSLASESACVKTASAVPPCKTLTAPPAGVSGACSAYLTRVTSYNSCVQMHQNDGDFRLSEWRVFEGNTAELWTGVGDTLVLLDQKGQFVSSASY